MKAFRNVGGSVTEIEVDVSPDGNPLLPPDTTVDHKPEALQGHYVTVVGNSWVQIPVPVEHFEFSYKKQLALEKLAKYKAWYTEQPVNHNSVAFDGDELSRARLIQALVINSATGYLPPAWVTYNNSVYPITVIADLIGIINAVQTAFATRFFEMNNIREAIKEAVNESALAAINIPQIPTDTF